ncbi:MAG: hypothetical protein NHG11_00800 [Candidatus Shikimatogenerans bostrichidophilus]|nr:MAG: hypothetical protein NHG11_00800 [Candidatus Shikimatogenerans bostrichidophilus]
MYKETPLIKQYYNLKKKYSDTILFFQVGDFYEIFGYDAIFCSRILNITLTKRNKNKNNSIYLVGFPCKALNIYLKKLIKFNVKVAICNQNQNKNNKNDLINREITNIITPNINLYEDINKKKSFKKYVSSIFFKKDILGLSFIDFSTGELLTTEGNINYIKHIINCFNLKEFFIQVSKKKKFNKIFNKKNKYLITLLDDNLFNYNFLYKKLLEHFSIFSLNCFGVENMDLSIISTGILIFYIKKYYNLKLNHVNNIKKIEKDKYVWIDKITLKNLEIIKSINKTGKSLLDILDNTYTSMGFRLLNKWIIFPLKNKSKIYKRLNIINFFFKKNDNFKLNIIYNLKYIFDIEKIISKISNNNINPNQLYKFIISLKKINNILKLINLNKNYKIFNFKKKKIKKLKLIYKNIKKFLIKDPINKFNKNFFIKKNISNKLDNYKKKLKIKKNIYINI